MAWTGGGGQDNRKAAVSRKNQSSVETRYCLLTHAFTPERFNAIVRKHWGIENRLHLILDVVFRGVPWCSTRTSPVTARITARKIWLCCGNRLSICPGWNHQRDQCGAS